MVNYNIKLSENIVIVFYFSFLTICDNLKGLRMEGSSSLRSNLASDYKDDVTVCRRCHCKSVRKVSHLSQNPGRI